MNPIINRIEEIRVKKGVTKTHIAKHCNRSVSWYNDIAKGRRRMYLEDIIPVAEALGEKPEYFFRQKLSESRNVNTA
ncbi:helix-turn-helix transcriptional regulator [Cohnella lubricantis]|uniref:Helix-turn-helix transcriptional regulator n=1 Tax=Cohnella lubricantis TaxID=2163172 RepID=A0A841T4H9_9BACL|nr:helix-turn-helix transcriptional regulator [Cohnella lubricantis]MBB6676463.1 helix-turn-helix transcriptional regulator [Cohnella lubricantis]MBP2117079.1 transcriptional regulator with XRE-family HTH domain [Cohnella lubricantis]